VIVDTSAVLAVAFAEQESRQILGLLRNAEIARISAANLFESFTVVDRRGNIQATQLVSSIVRDSGLIVEPVTLEQVELARVAWQRYGRGSGHSAKLNFGDCFAYALAKERNEPLLFVGNDFMRTDLVAAL